MAKAKKDDFETRMARLGEIVEELEKGELPLERGVALYKEGLVLVKSCRRQLNEAANEVKLVDKDELQDFVPEEESGGGS
jgi:exodeoxyribonuclease VII small subunit